MGSPIDDQDPIVLSGDDALDVTVDPHVSIEISGDKTVCAYGLCAATTLGRDHPPADRVGLDLWQVEKFQILLSGGIKSQRIVVGAVLIIDFVPVIAKCRLRFNNDLELSDVWWVLRFRWHGEVNHWHTAFGFVWMGLRVNLEKNLTQLA